MASLGVQVCRLSVEWARLEPRAGEWDDSAFERYRAELQLLRDKGIRPLVTLHHFSHPLWFERDGGWLAPGALWVWERFVAEVVTRLGDLVAEWVTINEPNVYVTGAHVFGDFPPGGHSLRDAMQRLWRAGRSAHPGLHADPRPAPRAPARWSGSPTTCARSGRATPATRGTAPSRRPCVTSSRAPSCGQ